MKKLLATLCLSILLLPLAACAVEQTEEGELPEVETTGGDMPEYDVDAADVEVGTETEEVQVPTMDVEPANESEENVEEPPVN